MCPVQRRKLDRVPDEERWLRHEHSPKLAGLTMLLNTKSWFPSSVKIFHEKPLTSLMVSALPLFAPTVEILEMTLLFLPIPFKKAAEVISELSWVTSNSPQAPTADAWTTRSGIGSRLK